MATDPSDVKVREEVITISDWPSDTSSVDYFGEDGKPEHPNYVLVFIPGNPGCIGWYTPNLVELVKRLGRGFAARGISYAGHSPDAPQTNVETIVNADPTKDSSIPWTVDGQVEHKIAYMDHVVSEFQQAGEGTTGGQHPIPKFIFLSHSIGGHMVERMCVLRPDIMRQTAGVVHLTPFTRMNARPVDQFKLDSAAARPQTVIAVGKALMHVLKLLPIHWLDSLAKPAVENKEGRDLAINLLRQPTFAKNFFELGSEEVRDVPRSVDTCSLRLIGEHCPISMLYCANDQWGPEFHLEDLLQLQQLGAIPGNVSVSYMPDIRHDYVTNDQMVPQVVDWCFESIQQILSAATPASRL